MRLRIAHQLALLFAGIALFSALAIGGWSAWNLKAGFSDYLRTRDEQQLLRFAQVVAQRVDFTAPDAATRVPMRELLDEHLHRDGQAPPPDWRPPPRGGPPGAGNAPPRPPRPRGPDNDIRRLQVVSLDGERLGGPPFPAGEPWLQEPVLANGKPVAYVRMLPSAQLQDVDARFLRRQYGGLAAAFVVTLLVGALLAVLAARRLARPLRDLQVATRRIAGGALDVQVPVSGSREMAELIADLNGMARALQRLEGARRDWIAQISHELRSPLSVLRGELESIEDGARQPTPELLAVLRGEVLQLVRLVEDLHTLSMADLGALRCEFSDGSAAAWVGRAAARFEGRLQDTGLTLLVQPGEDARVRWDFGRVEQLLTNLLANSARYTDAPGKVLIAWTTTASEMQLRVEDTAPGVPAHLLPQLFEPLFRVDAARSREGFPGGSGLGLAICRAIAQAHGGRIEARASALGGVCMLVTLPLQAEGRA